MHQVNIEEAKDHLPESIDAAVKGEQIVITKDDQNSVKLVPLQNAKPRPQFGSRKCVITGLPDFPIVDQLFVYSLR
jgi:antitoxin (DNA-binding transcriptional repressor) of toxin-antitoxin stability system